MDCGAVVDVSKKVTPHSAWYVESLALDGITELERPLPAITDLPGTLPPVACPPSRVVAATAFFSLPSAGRVPRLFMPIDNLSVARCFST